MHAVTQPTVWIHGSNGLRIREYSPEQRIECLFIHHSDRHITNIKWRNTDWQTNRSMSKIIQEMRDNQLSQTALNFANTSKTRGKVLSSEYRSPRKRNSRASSTNHCPQAVLLLIYYHKTIQGQGQLPEACYPRESFREGLCNHRRWFVCLSVCFFTTITK